MRDAAVAVVGFQEVAQFGDSVFGGFEAGFKVLVVGAADDFPDFGDGFEMVFPAAGNPDVADSTPGDELAGTLAGAAFADAELLADFLEGERPGREVKEAVDLAEGARQTEVFAEVGAGFDEAFAGGDEFAIVGGRRWCWGRRRVFFWRRFGHRSLEQKQASPPSVRFGRESPATDWKKSFSLGQFVQSELNKYGKGLGQARKSFVFQAVVSRKV